MKITKQFPNRIRVHQECAPRINVEGDSTQIRIRLPGIQGIQGPPGMAGASGSALTIAGPFSANFDITANSSCRIELIAGNVVATLPDPTTCAGAGVELVVEQSTDGQLILATEDGSSIGPYASGFLKTGELWAVFSLRSNGAKWVLLNFFVPF